MPAARRLAIAVGMLLALPPHVRAEDPAAQTAAQRSIPRRESAPDFFLGQPRGWLSFRGGLTLPRAGGALFEFVGEQLTLSPSDFRGRAFDAELGVNLGPLFAVEGTLDINRRTVGSEYRRFVSSTAQPIAQVTKLAQSGFQVGVRVTPSGHGQRISRLAFIPRRITPYGSVGLQMTYYEFRQVGDFVDFQDLSIFQDVFSSKGWAAGPYIRGGVDVQVWRRLFANADVRYSWLRSDLSDDFLGFDGIDLAGARAATGISVKF